MLSLKTAQHPWALMGLTYQQLLYKLVAGLNRYESMAWYISSTFIYLRDTWVPFGISNYKKFNVNENSALRIHIDWVSNPEQYSRYYIVFLNKGITRENHPIHDIQMQLPNGGHLFIQYATTLEEVGRVIAQDHIARVRDGLIQG